MKFESFLNFILFLSNSKVVSCEYSVVLKILEFSRCHLHIFSLCKLENKIGCFYKRNIKLFEESVPYIINYTFKISHEFVVCIFLCISSGSESVTLLKRVVMTSIRLRVKDAKFFTQTAGSK